MNPTDSQASPQTVKRFQAPLGRPLMPCKVCGGKREGNGTKLRGLFNGKTVPMCSSCKARPQAFERQWAATLPARFWFRSFPEKAAAGFRDAVLGVWL